ncbi:MAG: sugar transferase [Syntrophobacteraceae bacterium]|nr:sugar transferase [Syntrophobacteraceae bacterium]
MQDSSSPRVLKFPQSSPRPSCETLPQVDALPSLEYDEEAFNRILALERKRSERSKRPFMLMLLSLEGIPGGEMGGDVRSKIFSCLESAKRDIDVLGWYKFDSIAGIIFTEISDLSDGAVADSIVNRIKSNLAVSLEADEIKKIVINIYFFPENSNPEGWSSRLTLYPDIREHLRSHKKSLFVKRLLDITLSFIALVLSAPLFAGIAALIKRGSKGPVFFRQDRVGKYGKTFTFIKFRSMYADNDPSIHRDYVRKLISASGEREGDAHKDEVFKIQNDPRVTPIGRFLRKTSLDELPQFINVLRGEMSLVGPRPPIPYELENYDLWHRRRVLGMKPGITGVWQVEGRSRTTFNEMVRMDIYYVTNWSLWLDLKLLVKTPLAVLTSKGAY